MDDPRPGGGQVVRRSPGLHTAIYGQLFELGTGGQIVPDLATSYSFSPDAKTVTINIRQGVTFTDGTPFNAQAVAYNWSGTSGRYGHQERRQPAVARPHAAGA